MKLSLSTQRLLSKSALQMVEAVRHLMSGCRFSVPLFFVVILAFSESVVADSTSGKLSASEVVVIVSTDSHLDMLTQTTLRSIFAMRRRVGSEGRLIKVFVLSDNDPVHEIFAKELLYTFPFNLRRIWDRRIYSGTGQAPIAVASEEEMREKVASTENAIGYIRRELINTDVKVVKLQ